MSLLGYDFIVVGGGVAGLVIASRLAENASINVLVLEAGEDHSKDPKVQTPGAWHSMLGDHMFDWDLYTAPQTGLNERSISLPCGRMLGGSGAMSTGVFAPISKIAVDAWERLGNPTWNYDTMLPYFKRFHTLNVPSDSEREKLHLQWVSERSRATSGPVEVTFSTPAEDSLPQKWAEALAELGFPLAENPYYGQATGPFSNPVTVSSLERKRSHAVNAYYKERPNLHVLVGAYVKSLVLDQATDSVVAHGVRYNINGGRDIIAIARKEVILAAGAAHTPKVLELSGIGSPTILQAHGIPVYIDNHFVGENLQDHPMVGLSFEANDSVYTMDELIRQDEEAIREAFALYENEKKGFLCSGGVDLYSVLPLGVSLSDVDSGALLPLLESGSRNPSQSAHPADAEYQSFVGSILESTQQGSASTFCTRVQLSYGAGNDAKSLVSNLRPGNFLSIATFLAYPLSRGCAHIASSDPSRPSTIDPRYFSHPLDIEICARHLQLANSIASTRPFADLLKAGGQRTVDSATLHDIARTKEYLAASTTSSWHYTSTCSMLPREKGGVVDDKLLVYGTRNVRIVDTSIFPLIPGANLQTMAYTVAERAADIIKEKYELQPKLNGL